MKKLYILLIGLFLSITGSSQSCLPDYIWFTMQTQIDSFQVNYPGCNEIEGDVLIHGSGITNLNGLHVLTSIGGDLEIQTVIHLTSLTGLNQVTFIGGNLDIEDNDVLTSLTGLEGLNSIGEDLIITYNNVLTSLTGLDNIEAGSIENLYIHNNFSLTNCEAQNICDYLSNPYGIVSIYNNAEGCNNPPEVAELCGISLPCLPYGNYYFFTQTEIDNFQTNFPGCSQIEGNVTIIGDGITNLNGLSDVTNIEGDLYIAGNPGLTSLLGLENLVSIGGYLDIEENTALTSLSGLEMLTSIGLSLMIYNNNNLISLSGLESLTFIWGGLSIFSNNALTSIAGLESLTSLKGNLFVCQNPALTSLTGLDNIDADSISTLTIVGNYSLSICEVQSVCDFLSIPIGYYNIHDNAIGCNDSTEVKAACGVGLNEKNSSQNQFTISPNPSSTRITIETSASPTKFQISIFNLNGQELIHRQITESTTVIDISNLPGGVYFVRMTGERTVEVGKVVKQ
ncbi:MAG: T9SS type A sorting domain-containing protein [Bacteroidales bacterium]|nr:T9SS type A sorting domain-containing protein [Bacteroidales bacterium]